MTASDLASVLGGKKEGREWRCNCPVHGGRSLSITEKDGRLLIVCRAGCPQDQVIKELRRLELWGGDTVHIPPPVPEPPDEKERRIEKAEKIWGESHPITPGDSVHLYLENRGIILDQYPPDLHYHPALPYWETSDTGKPVKTGTFPAMLAVVRDPQGRPVALHRTYLTEDGHKAPVPCPKKLLKVFDLVGSSVRIFPPKDGLLGVCEGVEDALSAWILWQIPTWSALGTSGLKGFEASEEIMELIVFADKDEPGRKAALELARKLKKKMAVSVRQPGGHKDLNELLQKGKVHVSV
jgi:putative DNA primase/helicase